MKTSCRNRGAFAPRTSPSWLWRFPNRAQGSSLWCSPFPGTRLSPCPSLSLQPAPGSDYIPLPGEKCPSETTRRRIFRICHLNSALQHRLIGRRVLHPSAEQGPRSPGAFPPEATEWCLSALGTTSHLLDGQRAAAARAASSPCSPGTHTAAAGRRARTGLCPPRAVGQPGGPGNQKQQHPPAAEAAPSAAGAALSYRLGAARGKSRGVLCHGTSLQIHCDWPADPGVAGWPGGRGQDRSSVAMVACHQPL